MGGDVFPCFSRLKSVQGAEDSSGIISISEVHLYPGVQPPFCMPGDIDTGSNLALERTPSVTSDCSQISGSSKAFMTDGELPSNKKKLGCKQQATGNSDDNVDVTIVFLNLPQLENPPFASWCFLWCVFSGWDLNSSKCARKYWRSCKENNPAATVTFAESSCVRQVKIWARNQGDGTGAGIQAMVLRGSDLGLFRKIRTGVFWCFYEFLHRRSWTHHELMMLMGFEWIWGFLKISIGEAHPRQLDQCGSDAPAIGKGETHTFECNLIGTKIRLKRECNSCRMQIREMKVFSNQAAWARCAILALYTKLRLVSLRDTCAWTCRKAQVCDDRALEHCPSGWCKKKHVQPSNRAWGWLPSDKIHNHPHSHPVAIRRAPCCAAGKPPGPRREYSAGVVWDIGYG